MKQQRLPSFVAESERFSLRFNCEHCAYFHAELEQCTHGYPNAEHRAENNRENPEQPPLIFCKEFELM